LWLDVDESPHFELEEPHFVLEWAQFEIEMTLLARAD
jgi:hypothetical protein